MGPGRPISVRLTAALAGALAALGLALPSTAGAATAKAADSFVDSIGVNVHLGFYDTPYHADFPAVKSRLTELGVRHVRDELTTGATESQYDDLSELASSGIHSTLILGDPGNGLGGLDQLLVTVETELPAAAEAVEGPNEYSTRGGSSWKEDLVAYQERLYETVKGDPGLASLPVVGPSIVHGDQAALGDVSAHLDYGNVHSYPEGNGPEHRMGQTLETAELNSGSKPVMATETGYTTALGWTPAGPGENRPISEAGMAAYMPRLFFEYFSRRIARTFSYELLDEFADPELDEREHHFGLLRHDLSPKPAFTALRNTIELLEDPGPAFTPGALDHTLLGDTEGLRQVLLQKRDGTFYLALWRLLRVWDPVAKEELAVEPEPVTLGLPEGIAATALYEPGASPEPVPFFVPSAEPTVEVGPEIVVVALSPVDVELPPANPFPPEQPFAPPLLPPPLPTEDQEGEDPAPRCVVPDLRHKALKPSRKRLRKAGCRLGEVRGRQTGARKVKRQSPAPGAVLAQEGKVHVRLGASPAGEAGRGR